MSAKYFKLTSESQINWLGVMKYYILIPLSLVLTYVFGNPLSKIIAKLLWDGSSLFVR